MKISVEKPGSPEEILEHVGVKGMKWGVRKAVDKSIGTKTAGRRPRKSAQALSKSRFGKAANKQARTSKKRAAVGQKIGRGSSKFVKGLGKVVDDTVFELGAKSGQTEHAIINNATDKLRKSLPAIKAKHGEYGKLRNRAKRPFSKEAKAYRADVKKSYLGHLEKSANEITNVRGTRQYTLKENGKPLTGQYFWKVSTQAIKHAADGTFTVRPIFDDEGWIVDFEIIEDDLAQSAIDYILVHSDGIRVMTQ